MTGSPKGVFPKKGMKKVNGEWVMPAPPQPEPQKVELQTPTDRRNWFRKMAGWPAK